MRRNALQTPKNGGTHTSIHEKAVLPGTKADATVLGIIHTRVVY